ncbi:hypothetical protein [Novosphingobium sp. M1R2S20]|uniref:Uncharacterized protein n=1 Tax=Novosphingobium rhizovicinum TaxID=3228928 RepID=A0ABV3RAQ8_9SPHN
MKLLLAAAAFAISTPALAQNAHADHHGSHAHHAVQSNTSKTDTCTAEHAAMGHCKPAQPSGHQHQADHQGECCQQDAQGKMTCCDKAQAPAKDCCADKAEASTGEHAGH